jgi:two-component sensor histidine kinase
MRWHVRSTLMKEQKRSSIQRCSRAINERRIGWRFFARSHEFDEALDQWIPFDKSQKRLRDEGAADPRTSIWRLRAAVETEESDFLDRLARRTEKLRPFSATALGIAVAAVAAATFLRWVSGATPVDLRFGVYLVAIMASGLLAGMPAAICTAAASILIVLFAFVPPYFALKWPGIADQINVAMAIFASLVTICFTYCCRVVLRRLYRREIANRMLVDELEHRGKNMFSINQAIVRKSLFDDPERADKIIGRFRAVQNASDLLTGTTTRSVTLRELLSIEIAPYDDNRLVAVGPKIEIPPEAIRHLLLIFHELMTNAAKYGALSTPEGRIAVRWERTAGRRIVLTWTESGGPEAPLPTRKGFGSELIAACVKALDGTIEKRFDRGRLSCSVTARIG